MPLKLFNNSADNKIIAHCLSLFCSLLFVTSALAQGWTKVGNGINALNPNNSIWAIATDTGGIVSAAGGFTDSLTDTSGHFYVAKWDGSTWSQLGTGGSTLNANGGISTLCVDPAHNVYAAGLFTNASGKYYVAKWDGTTWAELGTGSNALNANSFIRTICSDNAGNIYAGGQFTDDVYATSGNNYVAKWDGTTWSKLGGSGAVTIGYGDNIYTIIADSANNIYAGGNIRYPSTFNKSVIKWDGSTWSQLGSGPHSLDAHGYILTLCAGSGGKVYAAGDFPNTVGKYYVAEWDGTDWNELGSGGSELNAVGSIHSLCKDVQNNIYAGVSHYFSNSGYVAQWNGSKWTFLGTGSNGLNANSYIFSIGGDKSGNIYAAGDFRDSIIYDKGRPYVSKFNTATLSVTLIKGKAISIDVYPNPANNYINIDVNNELIGTGYSICDYAGKSIISANLRSIKNVVAISDLPNGSYILRLDAGNTAFKICIYK
jgi:hypothetical protein